MRLHIIEGFWEWRGSAQQVLKLFSTADYLDATISRVKSRRELYSALKRNGTFDMYYFSFHGDKGMLKVGKDSVKIQNIFRHIPDVKTSIVHFASCITLKGHAEKTYRPFPHMLSGYTKEVDWFYSLANELILINLISEGLDFSEIRRIMYESAYLKKVTGFTMSFKSKRNLLAFPPPVKAP